MRGLPLRLRHPAVDHRPIRLETQPSGVQANNSPDRTSRCRAPPSAYGVPMQEVHLTGQLVCADQAEAALVNEYLPTHIALTQAEPGCLLFAVTRTGNPLIWRVEERFIDPPAFRAHQRRVAASEWGQATSGISRHYSIDGLVE